MAYMCPYLPEVQVDLTCEKGMDLRNVTLGTVDCTLDGMRNCPAIEWTCSDCVDKGTCKLAFDPYNTDGDCLMMK